MTSDSESVRKNDSTQHDEHKPGKKRDAAQAKLHVGPAPVEPDRQETPCHYRSAYDKKKPIWERVKPFIEVAGLVLLAIYTAYTIKMYRANKEAADAAVLAANAASESTRLATNQMVFEERPWVTLIPGEGVPDSGSLPHNGKIGVQYIIANPGKSAAIDLKWETFNHLVRPGQFVEPIYVQVDPIWTTKMYPGSSTSQPTTLSGPTVHSDAANKAWQNRDMWEELAIRITYRDAVDATHPVHVTESCIFVIFSNAANPQCPSHNDQK